MSQEPTIISQSREAEADTNTWKLSVLGILGIVSAFGASYYLNEFFITVSAHFLLLGFICVSLFVIFLVLNSFFIKSRWLLVMMTVFQGALFLLFFFHLAGSSPSTIFLLAIFLFLFFVMQGVIGTQKALRNSIHAHFFQIARVASSKIITAFLIFLSIIFYVHYFEQGNLTDTTGKKFSDYLLNSLTPAVQIQIPEISFDESVNSFITDLTKHTLQKSSINIADPTGGNKIFELNFSDLPEKQKEELIKETAKNIRSSIEKNIGQLNGEQNVRDALFSIEKNFVGTFSENTKLVISIGFTILLFFTLKGISFIWLGIIDFLSFLIFKLLIVLKFGRVSNEMRVREFITLP